MSQNYRLAQPETVKTTTANHSINISLKRDGTVQTKMTLNTYSHGTKIRQPIESSSQIYYLNGNKPLACDVTSIRL